MPRSGPHLPPLGHRCRLADTTQPRHAAHAKSPTDDPLLGAAVVMVTPPQRGSACPLPAHSAVSSRTTQGLGGCPGPAVPPHFSPPEPRSPQAPESHLAHSGDLDADRLLPRAWSSRSYPIPFISP